MVPFWTWFQSEDNLYKYEWLSIIIIIITYTALFPWGPKRLQSNSKTNYKYIHKINVTITNF